MPTIGTAPNANPLSMLRGDKLRLSKGELISVAAGAEQNLLNTTGPGDVASIWMAVGGGSSPAGPPALDCRLRIYYDGSATPAFDVDLGTLLGTHLGGNGSLRTTYMHAEILPSPSFNTGFLMTFPIPFGAAGVRIAYYNSSSQSATIYWMVGYSLYGSDRANGLRLRSQGKRYSDQAVTLTSAQTYTLATMSGGPGSIVYHSYAGVGATNLSWLERNPTIAVDGEGTPAIVASGTEDWFDSAWYFNGWANYETSRHGFVGSDAYSSQPYTVVMAIDLLSKWGGVPFNTSATFTLPTESACTTSHTFSYCVLYYQ